MKKIQICREQKFFNIVDENGKLLYHWPEKFCLKVFKEKEVVFASKEQCSMWLESLEEKIVKQAALYFLKYKSYSVKALKEKLLGYNFSPKVVAKVLTEFSSYGWVLNDEHFLDKEIIKAKKKCYGREKIVSNLLKKGVSEKFIEKHLQQKFPLIEEKEMLEKLLFDKKGQRKLSTLFFKQRGFSLELIEEFFFKNQCEQDSEEMESHHGYSPFL